MVASCRGWESQLKETHAALTHCFVVDTGEIIIFKVIIIIF